MDALRKEMRKNRSLVEEALESGHADPTAVGELVLAGHALREEERRLRDESKAAFESLLTTEQQLRLQALEAVREGMGPRGPRRGPGAPPEAWGPPGCRPEPPEEE
jgi:Spy/CpxP family protein refolding chaperone